MTLSHTMLAIEILSPGGPDVLQPTSVPVPVPGHGQIIIRVAYAGVNRPDALQRAGIRFVLTKHENAAGFMAEGVWNATGAPGVLVATVGPGVANADLVRRVTRAIRRALFIRFARLHAKRAARRPGDGRRAGRCPGRPP